MVTRVRNENQVSATNIGNPLAIARAGRAGVAAAAPFIEADKKAEQEANRQSELLANVETDRVLREVEQDRFDRRSDFDESGANHVELSDSIYRQRISEARGRLANDFVAREIFDEAVRKDEQSRLGQYEKERRDTQDVYWIGEHVRQLDDSKQVIFRSRISENESPSNNSLGGFRRQLTFAESSGKPSAFIKEEFKGREFAGLFQMGRERLEDYNRANGTNISFEEMRKSRAIQEATGDWHLRDIDSHIRDNDLDRLIGRQITGEIFVKANPSDKKKTVKQIVTATITMNGLRAAAHLGGKQGMQEWVTGKGKNHKDSNNTTLMEYMQRFGNHPGTEIPKFSGEPTNIWNNPVVSAERQRRHKVIDLSPLSNAAKSEAKRQIDSELAMAAVLSMSRDNPSEAFEILQRGTLDKELSFKQDQTLQNSLRKQLENTIKTRAAADNKQAKADAGAAVEDWIAWNNGGRQGDPVNTPTDEQLSLVGNGKRRQAMSAELTGQAVIDAQTTPIAELQQVGEKYNQGGEGIALRSDAAKAFNQIAEKRIREHNTNQAINFAKENGLQPPTANKDVRNELNRRFAERFQESGSIVGVPDFVHEHKFVPDGLADVITGALNGDNPEAKAEAVEMIGQLHRDFPVKISDAKSPAIDKALAINTYLQKGVQLDEALKLAQDIDAPVNPTVSDGRKQVWNQKVNKESMGDRAWEKMSENLNELSDDGWFFDSPAGLPETAWAEYADLARDKFIQTGDFDVAVNLAQRAFLARHAITGVGGARRWQKDAPERRYAVYGDERDTAWIQADAIAHAKQEFPNAEQVILRPISGSYRDQEPEYQVFTSINGTVSAVAEPFIPNAEAERVLNNNEVSQNTDSAITRAKALNAQAKVEAAVTELQRLRMRVGRSPISRERNQGLLDAAEQKVRDLELMAKPFMEAEAKRKAEIWDRVRGRLSGALSTLGRGVEQGGLSSQ